MRKDINLIVFVIICALIPQMSFGLSTAEMLGYDSDARVLIINADDFGMCHAENEATMDLLQSGGISSSTIMVPCGWFREAAKFCVENPTLDVGVHLTLTAEWGDYKWGGVASSSAIPSLLTWEGFFPESELYVELHGDADEVKTELTAQVEKAITFGITPTHIDNHMGSVYGLAFGKDFFDAIFNISREYNLPFRLPRKLSPPWTEAIPEARQAELIALADSMVNEGFVLPDYLKVISDYGDSYEDALNAYSNMIKNLEPGVTELYIHAAVESDEIKAITSRWRNRDYDYRVFDSAEMRNLIESEGIHLIGWADLQQLQIERMQNETVIESGVTVPTEMRLMQNYPNPFNPTTSITYTLEKRRLVDVKVYNALGKEVEPLIHGYQEPGQYQIQFSAKELPSGVYFCTLKSGTEEQTIKMVLTK